MASVTTEALPEIVAARLAGIRDRVRAAGGEPERIRIVAVTKGFGVEACDAAEQAGLADLGENYAQELVAKAATESPAVRWHYLGRIQRNKVPRLAPLVTAWHGVDRPAAATAIAAARPGVECFVEVNVSGAAARPGCRPEELDDLVGHCRGLDVDLAGLMAVAPEGDPAGARECFHWLATQARKLGLRELSMGMSDDFEQAVAEGATTLRLGRALFGPRSGRLGVRR